MTVGQAVIPASSVSLENGATIFGAADAVLRSVDDEISYVRIASGSQRFEAAFPGQPLPAAAAVTASTVRIVARHMSFDDGPIGFSLLAVGGGIGGDGLVGVLSPTTFHGTTWTQADYVLTRSGSTLLTASEVEDGVVSCRLSRDSWTDLEVTYMALIVDYIYDDGLELAAGARWPLAQRARGPVHPLRQRQRGDF